MIREAFEAAAESYDFSKVKAQPFDASIPEPGPEADVVIRALTGFSTFYLMAIKEGRTKTEAICLAKDIYVLYMPLLIDAKSIRDNIACVSQGLLHNIFEPKEANSLLYAAQVALSLLRKNRRRTRKK